MFKCAFKNFLKGNVFLYSLWVLSFWETSPPHRQKKIYKTLFYQLVVKIQERPLKFRVFFSDKKERKWVDQKKTTSWKTVEGKESGLLKRCTCSGFLIDLFRDWNFPYIRKIHPRIVGCVLKWFYCFLINFPWNEI